MKHLVLINLYSNVVPAREQNP